MILFSKYSSSVDHNNYSKFKSLKSSKNVVEVDVGLLESLAGRVFPLAALLLHNQRLIIDIWTYSIVDIVPGSFKGG